MWRTLLTLGSGALRPVSSRCLAAIVLLLATAGVAAAQDGAIGGLVTAVTGETITGAQVHIPGTSFGTLTDDAGRYRLTGVPAGEHLLRVSTIGYQGSEQLVTVTAGEVATVDFVLEISAVALDQIVATITGERRRRELATDITTIDANVVSDNTRTNKITDVLKGQSTGVFVRQNSGTVGGGYDVRIRGTGSISLSNQPLYVLDGAIIDAEQNGIDPFFSPDGEVVDIGGQQSSRINDLNPDEIESIEIIKGPAASALWGARGNAGVILITTKKGSPGDTRWQLRADLGSNQDRTDWPSIVWRPSGHALGGDGLSSDQLYTMNVYEDGTFQVQDGFVQNYSGNVSGGGGLWSYFGSVQYGNEQGIYPSNSVEKFNFRINTDLALSNKLDITFSNGFTSSTALLPENDNNSTGFIGNAFLGFAGWKLGMFTDPVTGESVESCPLNFEFASDLGVDFETIDAILGPCPENPTFRQASFDQIASTTNTQKVERYTGSGNVTWTPVPSWINRFTIGYDMFSNRTTAITQVDVSQPFGFSSLGAVDKPNYTSRNLTLQGTTTYLTDITSALGFEFVGGVQWFRNTREATIVSGQVFPGTAPTVGNSVTQQADDGFDELKTIGFFVQGQFDVSDRLFVNGAVRWDNNSASGENLGVQTYPKFGASFVAIEGAGAVNMIKLRGGWGQSGKLPNTNDARALLTTTQVSLQATDQLGVSPFQPGNSTLSPETGQEWEAGVDMAFLQDRIGLTFTYYDQTTKNTVVTKNLAPSTGFPEPVFTNIGRIDNTGWEVSLDALALDSRNVSWDWRFIVTNNDNTIVEQDDPILLDFGEMRHQQGLPFASYVAESFGFDENGDPRIIPCSETPGFWGPDDTPGAREDFCDPLDDHRFQGESVPAWVGSVQTTLQLFRHISLYALLDFQSGNLLYNATNDFVCGFENCPAIYEQDANGDPTDNALIKDTFHTFNLAVETPWLENAKWAKLRTVQARFELPESWIRSLNLRGLSLSLTAENLVTWTDYSGLDPEISWRGQFEASRSEFLTQPPFRKFLGTINITF